MFLDRILGRRPATPRVEPAHGTSRPGDAYLASMFNLDARLAALDCPGSTMSPHRATVARQVQADTQRLAPKFPAPPVSPQLEGTFVVIRDRVDDVFDVRFVPPTFIVEECPKGSGETFISAWPLDGNGMRFRHRPGIEFQLDRYHRSRIVARFHTFAEADKALTAARNAWDLSQWLPEGNTSRKYGERVQVLRAELKRVHDEADKIRDRMTGPLVGKLAEAITDRRDALMAHVVRREAAMKRAMGEARP